MHRTLLCQIRRHISGVLNLGAVSSASGRFSTQALIKSLPSSTTFPKSIHTSLRVGTGDDGSEKNAKTKSKLREGKRKAKSQTVEDQLQSAAVEAAKSLPGDWTRTADNLMARLTMHGSDQPADDIEKESNEDKRPLLSTMKVAKGFERTRQRNFDRDGQMQHRRDTTVEDRQFINKRKARKFEKIESLSMSSQPRLGIFDAEKVKAEAGKDDTDNLWQVVHREKMELAKGNLPRNGFEEMIQWTKEGRLWTFPVDNEEDMHEERQYEFHEHVFLSHHMGDFPKEGPIRRFMDLVVIGLSRNPWISVPEKVEHIQWYASYFRQKQGLLESSIGDKAKMKQS